MLSLFVASQVLVLVASVLLFVRFLAVTEELTRRRGAEPHEALSRLLALIERRVDEGLLPDADWSGLRSVPVPAFCRESADTHGNLRELLDALEGIEVMEDRVAQERAIKLFYQAMVSLDLPSLGVESALRPILEALEGQTVVGAKVGMVRTVRGGELVDRTAMFPLTHGAHVRQPLGVVLIGENGDVLSKAKVICR